jgi:hypothetical protein
VEEMPVLQEMMLIGLVVIPMLMMLIALEVMLIYLRR